LTRLHKTSIFQYEENARRVCGTGERLTGLFPASFVVVFSAAQEGFCVKNFKPAYGTVPPLISPFNEDKSIDWYAYDKLIDWHIERNVTGLFIVCGSSEYFQLTEDEAVQMAKAAVKHANGRIHILAGSTNHADDDLAKNINMTKRMADAGVDGCFITTPRTIPAEDSLMLDYHMKIHDAVSCPVYAYEMPGGTHYKFSPEAFAKIGEGERFIGIKDTTCDLATVGKKIKAAKGTIKIMQAHTPTLLDSYKLGATGAINTSANVEPSLFQKLFDLYDAGDLETAERLQKRIVVIDQMMSDGYVKSAKIAVNMMGVPIKPYTRNPSKEFTAERMEELKKMCKFIEESEKEFGIEHRSL
jgi:4-hydroxy-tetrahydrodipicolinate synthase